MVCGVFYKKKSKAKFLSHYPSGDLRNILTRWSDLHGYIPLEQQFPNIFVSDPLLKQCVLLIMGHL